MIPTGPYSSSLASSYPRQPFVESLPVLNRPPAQSVPVVNRCNRLSNELILPKESLLSPVSPLDEGEPEFEFWESKKSDAAEERKIKKRRIEKTSSIDEKVDKKVNEAATNGVLSEVSEQKVEVHSILPDKSSKDEVVPSPRIAPLVKPPVPIPTPVLSQPSNKQDVSIDPISRLYSHLINFNHSILNCSISSQAQIENQLKQIMEITKNLT